MRGPWNTRGLRLPPPSSTWTYWPNFHLGIHRRLNEVTKKRHRRPLGCAAVSFWYLANNGKRFLGSSRDSKILQIEKWDLCGQHWGERRWLSSAQALSPLNLRAYRYGC